MKILLNTNDGELYHADEYDSALCHWGIPGMHWRIRRYQYPDGSLTPAGYERYYGHKRRKGLGLSKNDRAVLDKNLKKEYKLEKKAAKDKYKQEKEETKIAKEELKQERLEDKQHKNKDESYVKDKAETIKAEKKVNKEKNEDKAAKRLMNELKSSKGNYGLTKQVIGDTESNTNKLIGKASDNKYVFKATSDLKKYKDMSTNDLRRIVERGNVENDYYRMRETRAKYSHGRRKAQFAVSAAASAATLAAGVYFTRRVLEMLPKTAAATS